MIEVVWLVLFAYEISHYSSGSRFSQAADMNSGSCPDAYLRYSPQHTYCAPRNASCPIFYNGITQNDKATILERHNQLRSRVAIGYETKIGGLPSAANMLQMVWDNELAAVAQKHVERCIYSHDCPNCRRVPNFATGQNLAFRRKWCLTGKCGTEEERTKPLWTEIIQSFYDEIDFFNIKSIPSIIPRTETAHFTQIIWAKTWRIGCGFIGYNISRGYFHYYACNYGPGGNERGAPIYESGKICSDCPINSCCGDSCPKPSYPGLCKLTDETNGPIERVKEPYLFYCDYNLPAQNCFFLDNGTPKLVHRKSIGGSYLEGTNKPGEKSIWPFGTLLNAPAAICLIVELRTGPVKPNDREGSQVRLIFTKGGSNEYFFSTYNSPAKSFDFQIFSVTIHGGAPVKFSVQLDVPTGFPPQFLHIRKLAAKDGDCKKPSTQQKKEPEQLKGQQQINGLQQPFAMAPKSRTERTTESQPSTTESQPSTTESRLSTIESQTNLATRKLPQKVTERPQQYSHQTPSRDLDQGTQKKKQHVIRITNHQVPKLVSLNAAKDEKQAQKQFEIGPEEASILVSQVKEQEKNLEDSQSLYLLLTLEQDINLSGMSGVGEKLNAYNEEMPLDLVLMPQQIHDKMPRKSKGRK